MDQSRKSSRLYLLIASPFTLILAALLYLSLRKPPDPYYAGKPLSQHLIIFFGKPSPSLLLPPRSASLRQAQEPKAAEALHFLGSRAVPLLSYWLKDADSLTKRTGRTFCAKYGIRCPELFQDRSEIALSALSEIPEYVPPTVAPILENWLNNPAAAQKQRPLLFFLLRQALEAERPATPEQRERVLDGVCSIKLTSPNDREKLRRLADVIDQDSTLRNLRSLRKGTHAEKVGAAAFFRVYPTLPERVVPLLIPCLSSTNSVLQEESAKALGAYGPEAEKALPRLSNLLSHPKPYVAAAASNAVRNCQR
ncbi:MAG TPA: hypothetical protein VGR78_05675 [Verrucomicrobiae bacterium]|jgi:HEAT repeat protein|nr:hypothetical protein [Verrucomicrobiae bacterium]